MLRLSMTLMVSSTLLLASCAGLPDRPKPPVLKGEVPLAGAVQTESGQWPDAQWWKQYQDPQLDALIELALRGAPTLASAQTRFASAIQNVRAASAASGVRVDANASWTRQRLSDSGLIPSQFLGFSWYSQADLGLQFNYDFDWWGKQRSKVESVVDLVHVAEAETASATLTLTSAVTDAYFGWQADQARLALAQRNADAQQRLHELTALRVNSGIDAPDELQHADADLAVAREQIDELQGSSQLRRVVLAALAGVAPGDLPTLQPVALPKVTGQLPENIHIDLIARRPDIAASRWRVESAARNVDAARAEFFPDISIKALAGLSAVDMDMLFRASSRVFSFGPALHLPIFDAGLIRARYGISAAELGNAVASYNNALTDAARDVATQALTLQQLDAQRIQRQAQVAAASALRDSADARERQGLSDARAALIAQAQLLQQQDGLIDLDARAASANVALQKALGGGYDTPATTQSN